MLTLPTITIYLHKTTNFRHANYWITLKFLYIWKNVALEKKKNFCDQQCWCNNKLNLHTASDKVLLFSLATVQEEIFNRVTPKFELFLEQRKWCIKSLSSSFAQCNHVYYNQNTVWITSYWYLSVPTSRSSITSASFSQLLHYCLPLPEGKI